MIMKQYVPKVRFGGFTLDWATTSLSKIAHVIDPHPSHRAPDAVANGVPFIGIGDVSENGYVDFKNVRIVPYHIYDEHRQRYQIEVGDFAYGRVASVGKIIDLSSNVEREYTYSPTMAIVKPVALYSPYLKSYMNAGVFKGRVDNKTTGSTRKSLGVQDFRELSVCFPEHQEEQVKIGDYFQKLDTLINQHQQKHDKLSNLKKAMLEKMFPKAGESVPEIRFEGFSGDWVEKSLEEIGYFTSGVGFSEKEQGGKSGIPFYKVSDMNLDGNYYHMNKANNYVDEKQIARLKYKPIRETAILFAKVGAAIFLERKRIANNFLMDNNMMAYIPDEDITFMKQWFDKTKLSGYTKVGALPSFNSSDLGEIRVRVPSYDEQISIGKYLDSLDKLINQYKQQITKLKNIKQACLDKMFV